MKQASAEAKRPFLRTDVGHAFAMRYIDKFERRHAHEILCSRLGAKVVRCVTKSVCAFGS